MDKLVSIRTNIMYFKKKKESLDEEDVMLRHHELIFVIEKEHFKKGASDGVLKVDTKYEQSKFIVSEENLVEMIELLGKLRGVDESTIGLENHQAPEPAAT